MPDRNDHDFVGTIPEHYDAHLGPVLFADYAHEMARRTKILAPTRVLETAAGTGIVSRCLRDQLSPAAHLTVTDLNLPMLEIARRKFRPDEAVAYQVASALALPFADGEFDLVVSQFGVMFYPDKDQSYREVFRVLAPGGSYLLSIWDSFRYNSFARIGQAAIAGLFPVDTPQFLAAPYSYTFESAKESLLAAGFDEVTAAVVRIEKVGVDLASLARGFVYGSPVIDQIKARGALNPEAVVAAIEADFRRAFPDGRIPLQATFISARKSG